MGSPTKRHCLRPRGGFVSRIPCPLQLRVEVRSKYSGALLAAKELNLSDSKKSPLLVDS